MVSFLQNWSFILKHSGEPRQQSGDAVLLAHLQMGVTAKKRVFRLQIQSVCLDGPESRALVVVVM